MELDTITCKKFLNSTKEIEQCKKKKLCYTYRKSRHLVQDYQQKPIEQNSQKKTQGQARKTTKEVNILEVVQGRGAYNFPKELNVIDGLSRLEFWQRVNNKLDDQVLEGGIDVARLEKDLSHLELESNMSTIEKRKKVD